MAASGKKKSRGDGSAKRPEAAASEATASEAPAAAAAADTAAPAAADDASDAGPALPAPSVPRIAIRAWEIALVAVLACALYLPRLGAYNLWDPWETHYGEVARRMLQDEDWIHLKWQNESFRSKPVLTFWLMGLGMKTFGVADGGGYSGELVSSPVTEWALRLPFALFGIGGLVMLWFALARLHSRRLAWLATAIVASSPYYFFVSRQAITDMPSCAMLIGSMALFALAMFDEDRELKRWKWGITWYHVFAAAFVIIVLPQVLYFNGHLWHTKLKLMPGRAIPWPIVFALIMAGTAAVLVWGGIKTRSTSQVQMYFLYLFAGLGFLAKGPVAAGLTGLTVLTYLVLTGEWKRLKKCEIPIGILIVLAVALPWHLGMYIKDGQAWINEYIGQHWLNRATKGVHGDKGTFNYYFSQLGVGMWPWAAFIPAALASLVGMGRVATREDRLRLFVVVWALVSATFFMTVTTKFHHYILPAIPAFGVMVAFYLDDLWAGRARWAWLGVTMTLILFIVVAVDFRDGQLKLVNLFIYRYDRPWPKGPPWNIDFTTSLTIFAVLVGAAIAALYAPKWRRYAVTAVVGGSLCFAIFAIQKLMIDASPHWGQKRLHEVYYAGRQIFGVDLLYTGLYEVRADWASGKDLPVRTIIPHTLKVGDPQRVTVDAGGEKLELWGSVAAVDVAGDRYTIAIPEAERQKMAPLVERARGAKDPPRRRFVSINAERLLAWQLNWRGENFWSGGEIYQHRNEDARTVFVDVDNKNFLEWLKKPERNGRGRKFWVITEKGRLNGFPNILPTAYGKQTFQVEDNSSNKFGLGSFTLDDAPKQPNPAPGARQAAAPDNAPETNPATTPATTPTVPPTPP